MCVFRETGCEGSLWRNCESMGWRLVVHIVSYTYRHVWSCANSHWIVLSNIVQWTTESSWNPSILSFAPNRSRRIFNCSAWECGRMGYWLKRLLNVVRKNSWQRGWRLRKGFSILFLVWSLRIIFYTISFMYPDKFHSPYHLHSQSPTPYHPWQTTRRRKHLFSIRSLPKQIHQQTPILHPPRSNPRPLGTRNYTNRNTSDGHWGWRRAWKWGWGFVSILVKKRKREGISVW